MAPFVVDINNKMIRYVFMATEKYLSDREQPDTSHALRH